MDLRLSESESAFRHDLRTWLAATLPVLPPAPRRDDWTGRRAYDTGWQRRLHEAGYAGVDWPAESGGRGSSPVEQLIYLEETARPGVPYVGVNFVGLLHAGPTIIAEGTPEQRRRHLPRILSGEEVWCQGFSEPAAGSDLAALRTTAVRDGDSYVVRGQKTWSSFAQVADYCELLVRTDPDAAKHKGITWLILPMDLPGIEIRPMRTLAGSAEFAELFLDDVRVPVANRIGAENDGWRVAMVTLRFERGTAFAGDLVSCLRLLRELAVLARASEAVWGDGALRRELGRLHAELAALWSLTKWNVSQSRSGVPGIGGSVVKLRFSELRQRLFEAAAAVLGPAALAMSDLGGPPSGRYARERLSSLSYTIAAGSSQIQRNIIGERILGLPREPDTASR
ncbi:acyl-CoA dehydrogenase family protein [Spirillospora sp. CA-128828]|uniref:acyl-CoA dehydrogenase family protein n=1 Tax=Spirillospora sp. CA-128828 TaxID=3240033 RepID=UPI003D94DB3D